MVRGRLFKVVFGVVLLWALAGCSQPRRGVTLEQIERAKVHGLSGVRSWHTEYWPRFDESSVENSDCSYLAISGGGANGAFGAGFLCGWTDSGKRPCFRLVTGISTGALIAPFAFLGSQYDDELREVYTSIRTKDVIQTAGVLGFFRFVFSDAYAQTRPLVELIAEHVTDEVIAEIAQEYAKGRRLYVATTHLDAQRLMVWDMGAIAARDVEGAHELFRKVMLASASVPGAFPPVYLDVEVDGEVYDEMHVDGNVVAGVIGYGLAIPPDAGLRELRGKEPCALYIVRNGKQVSQSEPVSRYSLRIVARSFDTMMKVQSWNDIYRLYTIAQRDGVDFNYVCIPDDYEGKGREPFDPEEMKRLFSMGYEMAAEGCRWQKTVPGLNASDPQGAGQY